MPIGLALVGAMTDSLGAAWVFVAGGALNVLLILLALMAPGIRKLD
jgi:hypothetical protein